MGPTEPAATGDGPLFSGADGGIGSGGDSPPVPCYFEAWTATPIALVGTPMSLPS